MRRRVLFAGALGAAVTVPFALLPGPAAEAVRSAGAWMSGTETGTETGMGTPGRDTARRAGAVRDRTVAYRGFTITVPGGWPVYRLDQEPARCVRFDQRAVYLGTQGPQPDCPARLVGRTEALQIEPLDPEAATGSGTRTASAGERGDGSSGERIETLSRRALARYTVPAQAEGEVHLRLPEAGVEVIGSFGSDPEMLQGLLRAASVGGFTGVPGPDGGGDGSGDGGGAMVTPRGRVLTGDLVRPERPSLGAARVPDRRQGWVTGQGFDTCTAPSLAAMAAWRPVYQVANIYIGGIARACAQPNLTAGWVRSVRVLGYRLIPTYVGLQAPCTGYRTTFHWRTAAIQGRRAATDAVLRARALGIPRRKPIYLDMEAYDSRRTKCRQAVLSFVHSWTKRLYAKHYTPGVYSSVASGIVDVGRAVGIMKPKSVWYAHWDGKPQVMGSPFLPDTWWAPHRRIKQYRGGHRETHNGVTINIDSNVVDGRVF